jgi:hypothetical protein
MWVCDGRPIHADVEPVAKLQKLPAGKLRPVVGDDGIRHPEPVDDVDEEHHSLLRPEIRDWAHLNPLGEFINGDQ